MYTKSEIKSVIDYAKDRHVQVILELDTPGHTKRFFLLLLHFYFYLNILLPLLYLSPSWSKGLPNITLDCHKSGTNAPYLDPTNEKTYEVLHGLLLEYISLFPSTFFHLGGEDVNTECWEEDEGVSRWMAKNGIDVEELLAFYQQQLYDEFEKVVVEKGFNHNVEGGATQAIVWEDAFFSSSLHSIVSTVQVWKSTNASVVSSILEKKKNVLVSSGWCSPRDGRGESRRDWKDMYTANSLLREVDGVLGGEVCFWGGEYDRRNIGPSLWASSSAPAEQLWSLGEGSSLLVADGPTSQRMDLFRCSMVQRGIDVGPVGDGFCPVPAPIVDKTRGWNLLYEPATFFIAFIAVLCITSGSFR